jgi:hypothetical protein
MAASGFAHDIDPHKWGESGWTMFLAAALAFPDHPTQADTDRLTNFYNNFGLGLPCTLCREHYATGIIESPVNVSSRRALVMWALSVHNRVNSSLGKPEWEPRRALQHWTNRFGCAFAVPGFEDIVPQSSALMVALAGLTVAALVHETPK